MQFKAAKKTTVAVGDDTWEHCFGHLLTRSLPFPSLNIKDIDTVDSKVEAEMPRQLAKGDWSFLVGHTLGVDHVGHMAVLDSELMHDKLLQVNRLIKETLKGTLNRNVEKPLSRPLQSLFLVFGDHGMTEAGAHGGGSSEEVDAGLLSVSTLPSILSPRVAQLLSPTTRLFEGRLPQYLKSHGAFHDESDLRTAAWTSSSLSSSTSLTPAVGYGVSRVRQVGLAPTLALLMGLPIPFNSMGSLLADLIPSVASFVQECSGTLPGASGGFSVCYKSEGMSCNAVPRLGDQATAVTVRCSDLAYLTQLYHISTWQQYRAIAVRAALTGNDAVLTDPQFAAARSHWLKLYFELDKEIKALPDAAHRPLTGGSVASNLAPPDPVGVLPVPPVGIEVADAELLSGIRRLAEAGAEGQEIKGEMANKVSKTSGNIASIASTLPSLVPYLMACAAFSQEALMASSRQLGTFNDLLLFCGALLVLCSLLVLVLALWGFRQLSDFHLIQPSKFSVARALPDISMFARCIRNSLCIWGAAWLATWAFTEVFKLLEGGPAVAAEVLVWRQLPVICVTGVLCSLVIPFGRSVLPPLLNSAALKKRVSRVSKQGANAYTEAHQYAWGFAALLRWQPCLSRLWLCLFGGGTYLCYFSLVVLCIVPFSDCLVDRECSVVRFLLGLYCIATGCTAFATGSTGMEKFQVISACAGLIICIRTASAFDSAENSMGKNGAADSPLQIDSVSGAAFLLFCIYCVVGREELPFVSRSLRFFCGSEPDTASQGYSRLQILGFHPLRGRGGSKPCTLERALFSAQAAVALLWFASPHESKSQQLSSASSEMAHGHSQTPLHNAIALLWSGAGFLFELIDGLCATCLSRLTPSKPWVFSAPSWMVENLPAELLYGEKVKLMPLLNVSLPWVVYMITAGIWMRLVLILCRLKQRENTLSTRQLHRAEAEAAVMRDGSFKCSQVDGVFQGKVKKGGMFLWRIEVWEYFSHYLLLAAVCPLCMYALVLGRMQLWPLLLCCIKWRLLLLLSLVRTVQPACTSGRKCSCCFCRATAADSASEVIVSPATGMRTADELPSKSKKAGSMQFFLSDASVCILAALLALDTFFATGHRTKLSALPVTAGFVGLLEFHPVASVAISFMHTYIIYMICCPLVFMIAFLRQAHVAAVGDTNDADELQGYTKDTVVQTTFFMLGKLAFGLLIGVTLRQLFSLLSLIALRNHLFIWDLFAVKFLYDLTAACLMYFLVIMTLLFVSIGTKRTPIALRSAT